MNVPLIFWENAEIKFFLIRFCEYQFSKKNISQQSYQKPFLKSFVGHCKMPSLLAKQYYTTTRKEFFSRINQIYYLKSFFKMPKHYNYLHLIQTNIVHSNWKLIYKR